MPARHDAFRLHVSTSYRPTALITGAMSLPTRASCFLREGGIRMVGQVACERRTAFSPPCFWMATIRSGRTASIL
jgi:hypothetical protein